jgi:hypothetical protein
LIKTAFLGDPAQLDHFVDVLCGLDGPTMADGLPSRDAPGFLPEFGIRGAIAEILLPVNKTNISLMNRLEEARRTEPLGGPMSEKAIDIGCQILRKARIPQALREEIEHLRRFGRPTESAVSGCEAPSIAADLAS